MQTKLPLTATRMIFIMAYKEKWNDDYSILFSGTDISSIGSEYTLLGSKEVTLDVPQIDLDNGEVANLSKLKSQILADAHLKVKDIDEKIKSLMFIDTK
ncbi:hypothetical protein ACE2AK_04015 [Rahnella perminowiae]|uniref:hypothetical protein n=1 Tax=Rahnella perminowiae TaxID=2816244 RepID=UPI001C27732A|nr:hypothetical protein [Rahnella perminowiae]MBU9809283.1 hypothetical protein [Rahnella perminowiae]